MPRAWGGARAVGDAIVVRQVVGRTRKSSAYDVVRRGANHLPLRRELAIDQPRVGRLARNPDRDVDSLLDQINVAVLQYQLDLELRVLRAQVANDPGELHRAERS